MTKIEWADETWNPLTGCYGPGGSADSPRVCGYCYAKRMALRLNGRFGYPEKPRHFEPTFHPDRLDKPLRWKKPRMIFPCSMADLFGEWVPDEWIGAVLDVVSQTPQHIYQFLTKWPQRLARWNPWPKNCWVGASATSCNVLWRANQALKQVDATVRFVSAEPWLDTTNHPNGRNVPLLASYMNNIDWFIVGQQTGHNAKAPDKAAIYNLVTAACIAQVAAFMKPPLANVLPNAPQEFPNVAAH